MTKGIKRPNKSWQNMPITTTIVHLYYYDNDYCYYYTLQMFHPSSFFHCIQCVIVQDGMVSSTYWQRINVIGAAPCDLFSWKKSIITQQLGHLRVIQYTMLLQRYCNILTLLAADPAASRRELAPHSPWLCFPNLCWIPTAAPAPTRRRAIPPFSLPLPTPCPRFQTGSR